MLNPIVADHLNGARLEFLERDSAGRDTLERFIRDGYRDAFDAELAQFMPLLIGLRGADGTPLAAMGIRAADREPLLLEHYLDGPVEREIARAIPNATPRRGAIVELGNLVVNHAGAARCMIVALNAYLRGAGFDWVVLTAVPGLRNAFRRLGLPLTELAEADGTRLGEARHAWGRYYDHRPVVVAGNVADGFDRLEQAFRLERALGLLHGLWEHALSAGRSARSLP
ncbi:thermostable hemolysin [Endothiovibrio diazotrophicus]